MRHPIAQALVEALNRLLPDLDQISDQYQIPWMVYQRKGHNSWTGKQVPRPAVNNIIQVSRHRIIEEAVEVRSLMLSMYPQYMGQLGIQNHSGVPANDPQFPLPSVLFLVWNKQSSFKPDASVIESVADSVVEVFERRSVRIRFTAPVINFSSEVDKLQLADGLVLRRLSEAEVTEFYGNKYLMMLYARPLSLDEFILEGELDEPFVFNGHRTYQGPSSYQAASDLLDRATVALRAFKQGPVGYTYVCHRPIGFCPTSVVDSGRPNVLIPMGRYHLDADEVERLGIFARLVLQNRDPALQMGCHRLSDAQVRTRPEDKIIDAAIGMEAILLAAMGLQDRGELKFRFAMNYAVLHSDPTERRRRFRLAKDLYNLRSGLAHGGLLSKTARVGSEKKLTPEQAAERACEALRDVLERLLPLSESGQGTHTNPDFWEDAYFAERPTIY